MWKWVYLCLEIYTFRTILLSLLTVYMYYVISHRYSTSGLNQLGLYMSGGLINEVIYRYEPEVDKTLYVINYWNLCVIQLGTVVSCLYTWFRTALIINVYTCRMHRFFHSLFNKVYRRLYVNTWQSVYM